MPVPLVFQDVINLLNTAVNRSDIASEYMDFINRAVREIAAGHSFDQMSEVGSVTLLINTNQVVLPPNFKDLQPGRFPAYAVIGGAPTVPVPVYRKEEISRIQTQFMPMPSLIFTSDGSGFQLGLLPGQNSAAAWVIQLYYFAYPDVVTDPTVGTDLLTFYPNLVISKVLSLIFQSLNDPIWEQHEKQFAALMSEFVEADIDITKPERSN